MKTVLIYGLAGVEPDKESAVCLDAVRRLGYRSVFVADRATSAMTRADVNVVNPSWDYEVLRDAAFEHRVDLALLMTDFASPLVGRLNDEMSLPGPSYEQYDLISNKRSWSRLAREAGLSMPREAVLTSIEELTDSNSWETPFIVKPTKSTANVSDRQYGYRIFSNLKAFRDHLERNGGLEDFLRINRTGGPLGKYMFQEQIRELSWNNSLCTFVSGKAHFHEMNTAFFLPLPHNLQTIGTGGPLPIGVDQQRQIDRVISLLETRVKIRNSAINFDVVTAHDGTVYTLDVNPRSSGTWAIMSPFRGDDYFESLIENFLGRSKSFEISLPAYLRRTITLPAGTIKSISFPPRPDGVTLLGLECCQPGAIVPPDVGRNGWPLEAIIVRKTLQECLDTYESFHRGIKIEYLNSAGE